MPAVHATHTEAGWAVLHNASPLAPMQVQRAQHTTRARRHHGLSGNLSCCLTRS